MSRFIFCVVGPSGSGKTTLAKALQLRGYPLLPSFTDRPARFEGKEGHIFVSKEEYDNLTDIVAETLYNNHRYCATAALVDKYDIYVVDPAGLESMSRLYKGNKEKVIFYLDVPKEICAVRMRAEGRSEQAVEERLQFDTSAFAEAKAIADYVIDASQDADTVAEIVYSIVELYQEGNFYESN